MSSFNETQTEMGSLRRVQGSTRTQETYRILKDAILSGHLKPEEPLSQEGLAESLGVSRTPLREAFRLLEGEGLVENRPWSGLTIAPISPDEMEELYLARVLLEGFVVRQAVAKIDKRELKQLASLLSGC